MGTGLPSPQGLYDPSNEHDGCGVGFIVDLKGRKSHQLVRDGFTALVNLDHRGACGCENNTGDGAGVLIQIPHEFLVPAVPAARASSLREPGQLRRRGVLHLARPGAAEVRQGDLRDDRRRGGPDVPGLAAARDRQLAARRSARAVEPKMFHALVGRGPTIKDDDAFERKLYVIRKRFETEIEESGLDDHKFFYFASLSCRTLVYKGMLTPGQVADYFADDLARSAPAKRALHVPLAVLHQHLPELAAGPSLPDDLAQRRDQHAPRQHQLDAGPRGPLRLRALRARRHRQDQADHPRGALRHGLPRQRDRAARQVGLQPAPRDDDADPRGLGKPRDDVPGEEGLLSAITAA